MPNINDYINWRGDLPFKTHPFNPLDNLVFSILSYFEFAGIVPGSYKEGSISLENADALLREKAKTNASLYEEPILFKGYQHKFIRKLAEAPRYRYMRLAGYVSLLDYKREMQFSAITIFPQDAPPYIAFRGTDSNLVGWKEDFNMALRSEIPAQHEAKRYLINAAKKIRGKFFIGGHSKGGNLAVYASTFAPPRTQARIINIFTNDGPGFNKSFIQSNGFLHIRNKIKAFVPHGSVVGLLFEHDYPLNVVDSDAQGLAQHNPFTWFTGPGDFIFTGSITERAMWFNEAIMAWIYGMDDRQREIFIESIYHVLTAADIKTVHEFVNDWFSHTANIVKLFIKSNPVSKKVFVETISEFIGNIAKPQDKRRKNVEQSRSL